MPRPSPHHGARSTAAPLIGISTSEVRFPGNIDQTENAEPPRRELTVGVTYADAVERAGGIPVVVPPMDAETIDSLLPRLGGLCISGGPDLDPSYYGARPHAELGPTFPDVDRFELALLRRAQARAMPVLAICRGLQLLNVSRGGTLVQHLPDRVDGSISHRQTEPGRLATHSVRIDGPSRLRCLMGTDELLVNSFHHQAVDRLGSGLRVVACAPDGVVEAIEARAGQFAVGVQWHAESLTRETPHAALFDALVEEAGAHESRDAAPAAVRSSRA